MIANANKKKEVLLDSSSAILLEKTGLLDDLLDIYHVILCDAVFQELTENSYPSAELFRDLHQETALSVCPAPADHGIQYTWSEISVLDIGERETILSFMNGTADFIMLDDGKGAKFCKKNRLPFINALLFPVILGYCGRLSSTNKDLKFNQIRELGRYSRRIVDLAGAASLPDLERFMP